MKRQHYTNEEKEKLLVRELMAEMGLISVRVYSSYLYSKEFGNYKNYLNQEFDVSAPNKIWVSDVIYFKYKENPYWKLLVDICSSSYCWNQKNNFSPVVRNIRSKRTACILQIDHLQTLP